MEYTKKYIEISFKWICILITIACIISGCAIGKWGDALIPEETLPEQSLPSGNNDKIASVAIGIVGLDTFDPLKTKSNDMISYLNIIFDGLFELDEQEQLNPQLLKRYYYNEEDKILDLYLKKDIFWHDGQRVTADDVAFTINLLKNQYDEEWSLITPAIISRYSFNDSDFSRCEVGGEDRSVIRLYNVNMDDQFLYKFVFPIVQKNAYINAQNKDLTEQEQLKTLLMGTGSYKVESINEDASITLTKNNNAYKELGNLEQIKSFFYKSREMAVADFQLGNIDAIIIKADTKSKLDYIEVKYDLYNYLTNNFEFLAINSAAEGPLQDIAVRRAIAYGIDRKEIVKVEYANQAEMVDVPIHPKQAYYWDSGRIYDYSVNDAIQILENADWIDINGDGYREKIQEGYSKERVIFETEAIIEQRKIEAKLKVEETGETFDPESFTDSFETERILVGTTPLELSLLINAENDLKRNVAKIIKYQLKSIGIEVKTHTQPWAVGVFQLPEEEPTKDMVSQLFVGDYQLALLGYRSKAGADLSFIVEDKTKILGINNEEYATNMNLFNVTEPALLEAIEKTRKYHVNKQVHKEDYKQTQQMLVEQLPIISLYYETDALMVNQRIQNIYVGSEYDVFKYIDQWE